ncbi:Nicotinic acetylcholine receptor non-alpha subunit [Fasciola gigantica]|uniref:Nicotinic acetylcholine receptor non-alpha subunit n=1 Tax=Fasciola gigantica TaxID=46835 RepID=A0A504Y5D2_FASGI|nr:Nicotinic acetylcholine receptor non-alpha subunit [Fasciola gigantica]
MLYAGMYEKRLLAHLFNQSRWDAHNPMERPTPIEGKPVQVFLKCYLNQIMDMDEKNQVLSTIIWLDLKWRDYHFQWNKSEYGNINQINVPPSKLWKPDIILYNSANENFDQIFPTQFLVRRPSVYVDIIPKTGSRRVCSIQFVVSKWNCSLLIRNIDSLNGYFHQPKCNSVRPFSLQNCTLKLGTWTYQGNKVDLKLQCDEETEEEQDCNIINEVDLSTYLAHSEWALERATVRRNADTYGGVDQTYIDVTIEVHMQRRALYYMFNIVVPCMIMSVMSLLVFTLPPDANEKIVLGVTTLLSLTMLLQLVGDKLPQTSAGNPVLGVTTLLSLTMLLQLVGDKLPQTSAGNPVLVLYFTCTIVLCSLSLVFAVVLLNCHHHRGGIVHAPWVITTFVNVWLASALRIERKRNEDEEEEDKTNSFSSSPAVHKEQCNRRFSNSSNSLSKYWLGHSDQQLGSQDLDFVIQHKVPPTWSNIIDLESEFRPTLLLPPVTPAKELRSQATMRGDSNHIELRALIKRNPYSGVSPNHGGSMIQKFSSGLVDSSNPEMAPKQRFQYSCVTETKESSLRKPLRGYAKVNNMFNQASWSLSSSPEKPPIPPTQAVRSLGPIDSGTTQPMQSNVVSLTMKQVPPEQPVLQRNSHHPWYSNDEHEGDLQLREFFEKARIIRKLKELTRELRYITSRMHREDKEAHTSTEWQLACRVLDRLCLVIFAALNLFTSVGILTSAPTIIKAFTCTGEPSKPM